MNCQNHAAEAAVGTCAGCAEPFCASCLVTVRDATYCGSCKSMAVTGVAPQVMLSQDAKSALWLAIAGVFCVGFVLGPIAIVKASRAKQEIKANPAMGGAGWANAAIVVGVTTFILSVLGLMTRVHTFSR